MSYLLLYDHYGPVKMSKQDYETPPDDDKEATAAEPALKRSVRVYFGSLQQKEEARKVARARGNTLSHYLVKLYCEEQRRQEDKVKS